MEPTPKTGSATTVVTKLIALVERAMGQTESDKTKTHLQLVATILGGVAEEGASFLADRFDTNALLAGILRVENGLSDVEGGITDVMAAIKEKRPATAQVGSAE